MRAGEILRDRYVLERVLGQGGMGVVWAARDQTNGSLVALKLLLDDGTSENNPAHQEFRKELRQRLKREAEACLKLAHHPNVVRVLDWSISDTEQCGPYIAMELLEGESLQQHLKRKRSLDPKVAARIAADVASCLTAAHAAKLIHRDLKPGNIYLHHEPGMPDDQFITKVLDFGVCKDGDSVEKSSDQTKTGMVLGSIAYMSPQQAMGSKNVDFRTDIWSVGVVLYEMLTGLRAFSGSVDDIIAVYLPMIVGKATNAPVPAPSNRMRNIPPELDVVVERCTKPKPADRYASAEDLARDLYAIAGLPMPVIPSAKASMSAKSPVGARELMDLYAPAILESNAVPQAHDERRFNHLAGTIPLMRTSDAHVLAPPVIEEVAPNERSIAQQTIPMSVFQANQPDASDTDATLFMPPKNALASLPRPPALNDPPADAAVRTQFLAPDAPIASPMLDLNEMHQALAAHRQSSTSIPMPDLADLADLAASGGTQMIMAPDVASPKREPSATTSALMSQALPEVRRGSVPSDAASTTSRRRRQNRGLLALIGFVVVAASGVVIAMIVMQPKPDSPKLAGPSTSTSLPRPPVSIAAVPEVPAPEPSPAPAESATAPAESATAATAAPDASANALPLPTNTASVIKPSSTSTWKPPPPKPTTAPTCMINVFTHKCMKTPAPTKTHDPSGI